MKKKYKIRITLKSALHINAGVGGDGRRIIMKNVYNDGKKDITELYIPATTLKGILRNKMEMNIKALESGYSCVGKDNAESDCDCVMCRFFGKAGFKPSRLIIDNLYMTDKSAGQTEIRTNNAINRYTRKAFDGALVSQEVISAAENPVFEGEMTVYYIGDMAEYEKILLGSLKMIDSIGSSKSRGLGYVQTEVEEVDKEDYI